MRAAFVATPWVQVEAFQVRSEAQTPKIVKISQTSVKEFHRRNDICSWTTTKRGSPKGCEDNPVGSPCEILEAQCIHTMHVGT